MESSSEPKSMPMSQLPFTPQGLEQPQFIQQQHMPPQYMPQQYMQPQYMQPQYMQPQTTQPATIIISQSENDSGGMRCNNCNKNVSNYVLYERGCMAWTVFTILLLLGFWPCCLIPLFADGCKDVVHHCSKCNMRLGKSK